MNQTNSKHQILTPIYFIWKFQNNVSIHVLTTATKIQISDTKCNRKYTLEIKINLLLKIIKMIFVVLMMNMEFMFKSENDTSLA